jgi:hypothetical protein
VSCCWISDCILLDDNHFYLLNAGGSPKVVANVVLSNDDEEEEFAHLPGKTAPIERATSTVDDAGDARTASAEAYIPGPTGASAPRTTRPPATDRVLTAPTSDVHGQKCMCIATKRSDPCRGADQIMIQVKLLPYRGPRSPLDLIASKIVLRHIFEAFRQMS